MRVIEIKDKMGNYPLMHAVYTESFEIVELLLSKGANVNHQNDAGKIFKLI